MKNFAFFMRMCFAALLSNKKITFIIVVSLTLGLLMPFYLLANTMIFVKTWPIQNVPQADRTFIICGRMDRFDAAILEDWDSFPGVEQYSVALLFNARVTLAGQTKKQWIYAVDDHFTNIENIQMVQGRFLSAEKECTISASRAQKDGLSLGDTITVSGINFTISGFSLNFNYYRSLFIPMSSLPPNSNASQPTIYLQFAEIPDTIALSQYMASHYPQLSIISMETAAERASNSLREGIKNSFVFLMLGLVSVIFSALNTGLLLKGRYEAQKKQAAIKLATGASLRDIRRERQGENLILALAANALLLLLRPLLIKIAPSGAEFIFAWSIHVVLLGISLLTAWIGSSILLRSLSRLPVALFLRGGV